MANPKLVQIVGASALNNATALLSPMLENADSLLLSMPWLEDHSWAAVPKPLDDESDSQRNARIASVIATSGHSEIFAICLSSEDVARGFAKHYRVAATPDALSALMKARAYVIRYALVPDNQSFAILFCDEVYLAAGPRTFVEEALGVDVANARARFAKFVDQWEQYLKRPPTHLAAIRDHYTGIDGD
jgi:hypothetical protein